jgi:hypothetical protein
MGEIKNAYRVWSFGDKHKVDATFKSQAQMEDNAKTDFIEMDYEEV